jgi:polysaccharide biosynthesis/export protein
MNSSKLFLFPAVLALACGCLAQVATLAESSTAKLGAAVKPPSSAIAHSEDYVIGSEDVLAINIWKEPEISRTLPVRPDGKITLPLVGDIQASGLTTHRLQDDIANSLRSYVSNPEVTVIVQEVKSKNFNIVGEIAKPGSYPLSEPITVLDAIALGGGLRDFAKGSHIYVLRSNSDGTHAKLPFDYKQVIKGKKLAENVALHPGDTVVVP